MALGTFKNVYYQHRKEAHSKDVVAKPNSSQNRKSENNTRTIWETESTNFAPISSDQVKSQEIALPSRRLEECVDNDYSVVDEEIEPNDRKTKPKFQRIELGGSLEERQAIARSIFRT